MSSVLVVLFLLYKLSADHLLRSNSINHNDVAMAFSMLHLKPNIHHSTHNDLHFLLTFIPATSHVIIANTLLKLVHGNMRMLKNAEWLYIIPLIHVLKKRVNPFDRPALSGSDIRWLDQDIFMQGVSVRLA